MTKYIRKYTMKKIKANPFGILITTLQGAVMGLAEILPGVSGSTFALIMGIYDDFINLLHSISDVVKEILKFVGRRSSIANVKDKIKEIDFVFGGFLVFGMLISIAVLSNVIEHLLESYPREVSAFFFGLVLASVSIPFKEMKERKSKQVLIAAVVFLSTFIVLGLKPANFTDTPPAYLFLLGGIVGVSGLILPGISGSFILLLLGLYEHVISIVKGITRLEIKSEEVVSLGLFLLGLAIGFIGFVRVLKVGLTRYPSELMAALIGLMLGSLRVLWPLFEVADQTQERTYLDSAAFSSNEILSYVVIATIAFTVIVLLNFTKKPSQREFDV